MRRERHATLAIAELGELAMSVGKNLRGGPQFNQLSIKTLDI